MPVFIPFHSRHTPWNEFRGTHWNALECIGMHWNELECIGTQFNEARRYHRCFRYYSIGKCAKSITVTPLELDVS